MYVSVLQISFLCKSIYRCLQIISWLVLLNIFSRAKYRICMISHISCSIGLFFFFTVFCIIERKIFLSFCSDTTGFISCMETERSLVNPFSIKEAVILNWLHDNLHSTGFQNWAHKLVSFFILQFCFVSSWPQSRISFKNLLFVKINGKVTIVIGVRTCFCLSWPNSQNTFF